MCVCVCVCVCIVKGGVHYCNSKKAHRQHPVSAFIHLIYTDTSVNESTPLVP